MRIKRLLVVVTLTMIAVTPILADDPAALVSARERYENEIRISRDRYLRELANLKATYTRQGNLDAANVISAEMDKVGRTAVAPSGAPADAVQWNGHYYWFPQQKASYREALKLAKDKGGHLVTIDSKEENDFIMRYITDQYTWIGIHRKNFGEQGDWVTVAGSPLNYQNWDDGQGRRPGQPYGGIKDNGRWHDFFGEEFQKFIVEWD